MFVFKADRKRAHHNDLEIKRRDHIKDSFHTLRDAIPNIKGEKVSVSIVLAIYLFKKKILTSIFIHFIKIV